MYKLAQASGRHALPASPRGAPRETRSRKGGVPQALAWSLISRALERPRRPLRDEMNTKGVAGRENLSQEGESGYPP